MTKKQMIKEAREEFNFFNDLAEKASKGVQESISLQRAILERREEKRARLEALEKGAV